MGQYRWDNNADSGWNSLYSPATRTGISGAGRACLFQPGPCRAILQKRGILEPTGAFGPHGARQLRRSDNGCGFASRPNDPDFVGCKTTSLDLTDATDNHLNWRVGSPVTNVPALEDAVWHQNWTNWIIDPHAPRRAKMANYNGEDVIKGNGDFKQACPNPTYDNYYRKNVDNFAAMITAKNRVVPFIAHLPADWDRNKKGKIAGTFLFPSNGMKAGCVFPRGWDIGLGSSTILICSIRPGAQSAVG